MGKRLKGLHQLVIQPLLFLLLLRRGGAFGNRHPGGIKSIAAGHIHRHRCKAAIGLHFLHRRLIQAKSQ